MVQGGGADGMKKGNTENDRTEDPPPPPRHGAYGDWTVCISVLVMRNGHFMLMNPFELMDLNEPILTQYVISIEYQCDIG